MSHGWCSLPPFHFSRDPFHLGRIVRLPSGRVLAVRLDEGAGGSVGGHAGRSVRVQWNGRPLSGKDRDALASQVRHMLRLDEDLGPFHRLASARAGFEWIPRAGAGRLLRSPTVFEDLVKLICTTNCTWALTEVMVGNLVQKLGEPAEGIGPATHGPRAGGGGDGLVWIREGREAPPIRAFPSPEVMANCTVRFYEKEIRAGYRARSLAELAEKVASGRLDVEGWLSASPGDDGLRKEILSVRGAGPYTAENLLKLLGRYEGLALDFWCRAKFVRMHGARIRRRRGVRGAGRPARARKRAAGSAARRGPPKFTLAEIDAAIARHYAEFGSWRGLALWCDLTRDWLESDDPPGGEGDKF